MDQKQQSAMNMQRLMQERNELAASFFEQRLNTELFPADKLTYEWRVVVGRAIMKTRPLMLKISLGEFSEVVKIAERIMDVPEITLFQFGVLSNTLETISCNELELAPVQYYSFIQDCLPLIKYYGERTSVIRKECDAKAQEEITMKAATMGKNGGLSKVKAEA